MEGQQNERSTHRDSSHVPAASVPAQSIERLTQAIERLNRRSSLWYGFWHGLLSGIGSTVGVVIILYGAAWLLAQLDFIPGLDRFSGMIQNILSQRAGNGK